MKKLFLMICCVATLTSFQGCQEIEDALPKTVESVDVEKYMGLWYELASIPQFFSIGCLCTTAEYAIKENGRVSVFNRCILNRPDGEENTILGEARVVPKSGNAKLSVNFGSVDNFGAPYWIVDLADDYSYAVVSDPLKSTLFILSRTPELDATTYEGIIQRLRENKYPVARLRTTSQVCNI